MEKKIVKAMADVIYFMGDEIPSSVANDKRTKFVLLGTPQEFIDSLMKELCNDVVESPICDETKRTFESELAHLINRYSREYESNTPDFILAEYLNRCLSVYNSAVSQRENWNGNNIPAEEVINVEEDKEGKETLGNGFGISIR